MNNEKYFIFDQEILEITIVLFPFEFSRKELLIEKSLFVEKAIFKLFEEKYKISGLYLAFAKYFNKKVSHTSLSS